MTMNKQIQTSQANDQQIITIWMGYIHVKYHACEMFYVLTPFLAISIFNPWNVLRGAQLFRSDSVLRIYVVRSELFVIGQFILEVSFNF